MKVWSGVLALSVLLFVWLAATLPQSGGSGFDESVQQTMAELKSEAATTVFKLFSYVGSTAAIVVITLIAAIVIGLRHGIWRGIVAVLSVAAAYIANTLLKNGFDRIRPAEMWGIEADGASFPSGNAMLAFVMFGMIALAVIYSQSTSRAAKITAGTAAVIIILFMGLSRVYFHVHYITDILAGYSAGLAVLSLVSLALIAAPLNRTRKGSMRT